jgi:hypothetical protein
MITLTPGSYKDIDFLETVTANGKGFEFVGCRFKQGLYWFGSGSGLVKECVFETHLAREHAIYTHNNGGGLREITRCLIMPQGGRFGIHAYSGSTNYLKDYYIHDNVCMYPTHLGGGSGLINLRYENNWQFGIFANFGLYTNKGFINQGIIKNNTFIESAIYLEEPNNFEIADNSFYTTVFKNLPKGFDLRAIEREHKIFIPFYESKRWNGIEASYQWQKGMRANIIEKRHGIRPKRELMLDAAIFVVSSAIIFRNRNKRTVLSENKGNV